MGSETIKTTSSAQSGGEPLHPLIVSDISILLKARNEKAIGIISALDATIYDDSGMLYTIEIGRELGFDVRLIMPDDRFYQKALAELDLIIIDKLFGFSDIQENIIRALIYEKPVKYVLIERGQLIPFPTQLLLGASLLIALSPAALEARMQYLPFIDIRTVIYPIGHDIEFMASTSSEKRFRSMESNNMDWLKYCSAPSEFGCIKQVGFLEECVYNKKVLDAICAGCEVYGPGTIWLESYKRACGIDSMAELVEFMKLATFCFWKEIDKLI